MFDNLSERLERSFKILKGEGKITEINVAETLKDVRKALLDADVNYKVAKGFTDTVKEKALGQNVLTAVNPSQLMGEDRSRRADSTDGWRDCRDRYQRPTGSHPDVRSARFG